MTRELAFFIVQLNMFMRKVIWKAIWIKRIQTDTQNQTVYEPLTRKYKRVGHVSLIIMDKKHGN